MSDHIYPRDVDPCTFPGAFAEMPACAFCGELGAEDADCPDVPCCADEDACHERMVLA